MEPEDPHRACKSQQLAPIQSIHSHLILSSTATSTKRSLPCIKISSAFIVFPTRSTCPDHLIFLYLFTLTVLSEDYTLWSTSLCNFLWSFVTFSLRSIRCLPLFSKHPESMFFLNLSYFHLIILLYSSFTVICCGRRQHITLRRDYKLNLTLSGQWSVVPLAITFTFRGCDSAVYMVLTMFYKNTIIPRKARSPANGILISKNCQLIKVVNWSIIWHRSINRRITIQNSKGRSAYEVWNMECYETQ